MRILVLGGSGFIGKAVVAALRADGDHDVLAMTRQPDLASQAEGLTVAASLMTAADDPLILSFAPEIIINLAGSLHPRASIGQEGPLFNAELGPFLNLLDTHRGRALRRVIAASSAGALYLSAMDRRVKSPADSAYFALKRATELFLESWGKAYEIDTFAARISNPIGKIRKDGFGVVNHFSRALLEGKEISFIGDYNVPKDYVDLDDVCDAFRAMISCIGAGNVTLDVGSGRAFDAPTILGILQIHMAGGDLSHIQGQKNALDLAHTASVTGWRASRDPIRSMCDVYDGERASSIELAAHQAPTTA